MRRKESGSEGPPASAGRGPRVVWTLEARKKLLPRRIGDGPVTSRVYKRGLLAELGDLRERWDLDARDLTPLSRDMSPWREMRRLLADASADAYGAALEEAARLRKDAPLDLRCALSFAFATDAAMSRDDAAACLEKSAAVGPPACATLLFSSLADRALLERLLRAYGSGEAAVVVAPQALEIVASLGIEARWALEILYDDADALHDARASARRCLEAMELIKSEEAAAFFAKRLDANEVRPFAARFFRDAPRLAVKVLAPLGTGRGKAAEAAKAMLLSAVAESPDLVDELLPELGDAGRRGIKAARDRAAHDGEEAAPEELPSVLARPPWRFKEGRAARVFEDVLVVDARVPIDPAPRSADQWAAMIHWVPNALVFSPRIALPVAHAWIHRPNERAAAEAWINAFPALAAAGLIPAAVGKPCAARTDAGRILRLLARRGHEALIRKAAELYGSEIRSIVEDVLTLDPLHDCPETTPKLGDFVSVEALPRPRLSAAPRKLLPLPAVQALCEMLAFSSEDFPYAGLEEVRRACEPTSLAELVWSIFSAWLAAGGSLKHPWPLHALAEIGGDTAARRLAPKIRAWQGEKAPARAEVGLDVLARIGTDVALMHLAVIAERARFPELKARARAKIAAVAEARGLSAPELADRLVPDLDLDPDGSKVLDYGPRSFRVGFDEHLEPLVRDEVSRVLRSLPKPTKADDPEKARAAQAAWRGLRDDVTAIAKVEIARMELAMTSRRRFRAEVFQGLLVAHPLLVHLVRRLVWGVYGEGGELAATFRVAEDRTLADPSDAPFTLDPGARVGVPHPLEMDGELLCAWGGVFSDYAIMQPFAQIGRETYVPTSEELEASVLRRAHGAAVPTGKLFGLEYRGFRRDNEGAGYIYAFRKELDDGQHVALLSFSPGIHLQRTAETPEQTLGDVALLKATSAYARPALRELHPITFSELVRDVEMLRR